jgi:hypothetical protein
LEIFTSEAISNHPIILPFWTGWNGTNPVGRTNTIDHAKDFYGYYGPNNPLPPELGVREEEPSFAPEKLEPKAIYLVRLIFRGF